MRVIIILFLILAALLTTLLKSQSFSNITYESGALIDIGTGADVCADAIIINGTYSGGGTICQGPLPVLFSSFTSSVSKNNVTLNWTTEAELNNSGFDVERKLVKNKSAWEKAGFVQGSGTVNEPKCYSYQDKKLNTGKYSYRLKQFDFNGNYEYFALESDVVISPPNIFSMSQNYPNPSNPKSKIDYQIPADGKVTIKLYDVIGREAVTIVNETKEAGYYTAEFDGTNLASGVYFYRLVAGEYNTVKKLVLVK